MIQQTPFTQNLFIDINILHIVNEIWTDERYNYISKATTPQGVVALALSIDETPNGLTYVMDALSSWSMTNFEPEVYDQLASLLLDTVKEIDSYIVNILDSRLGVEIRHPKIYFWGFLDMGTIRLKIDTRGHMNTQDFRTSLDKHVHQARFFNLLPTVVGTPRVWF